MKDITLINKLSSGGRQARKAWEYFLDKYSGLILKVIRVYTQNYDEVMNKYLFVCAELSADSFKRLKKYDVNDTRRASFSTWLKVVVSNLCIDEIRSTGGRKRLPRGVLEMSEEEKRVFKLYYWEGLNEIQIANQLNLSDKSTIFKFLENINEALGGRRQDRGKYRQNIFLQYNDDLIPDKDSKDEDPELEGILKFISSEIESLSHSERLIVKLKYWNNWRAKEISDFVKSPKRKVYSTLNKILYDLRKKAVKKNFR